MSVTLDNTLGGVTANSYVDVAYADDYFSAHYSTSKSSAWNSLSANQKSNALIAATRVLETAKFTARLLLSDYGLHYDRMTGQVLYFSHIGEPVRFYYKQRLQFPRNLDINPDTGLLYIPEPILLAQCEQAVYMITFDEGIMANRIQGVVGEVTAMGRDALHIEKQYAGSSSSFAPMALEFIREYLVLGGRVERG